MEVYRPAEATRNFNNTLQASLMVLSKKLNDPSVRSIQSLVNAAVTLHPYKLIDASVLYMIQNKKKILEKDSKFFLNQVDETMKTGKLSKEMSDFLSLVGRSYPSLSENDKDYVWSQAKALLYHCASYQLGINNAKSSSS